MKIHVNLNQSSNPVGWSASIAPVHQVGDKEISMGESVLYPSKKAAWDSIKREVEKLDYENDEILFNRKAVEDYNTLLSQVNAL